MNQRTSRKINDLKRLVRDYTKLKVDIGKKKILQRIKIRLRTLPTAEAKVVTAFLTIVDLNKNKAITDMEIMRRIICLTDMGEFEINAILTDLMPIIQQQNPNLRTVVVGDGDEFYNTLRQEESVIDPEDAAINEYCEVELKKRFQKEYDSMMVGYG